jgi:hypothetical protein
MGVVQGKQQLSCGGTYLFRICRGEMCRVGRVELDQLWEGTLGEADKADEALASSSSQTAQLRRRRAG